MSRDWSEPMTFRERALLEGSAHNARPTVVLDLEGPGGNSVAILAACRRAAREHGWPVDAEDALAKEMVQSTREQFIDMVFKRFDVIQPVKTYQSVNRDQVQ